MCMVTFSWEETDAIEKVKNFEKTRSLSWALVELTNLCNFNCIWCYASSGLKGKHMSKDNAKKLVRMLADAGIKQVTCSGGEPLMYPYIKEFIKDINDHGMIVHMNTNGYFLTKKLAKELYKLGLTQVQTNIDSLNPKIHDSIRGIKGSFIRAVKAIKNARDVGLICVSQTVLTKLNEREILNIFKFARSIGVQRCRVWDMMIVGRTTKKIDLRPNDYIGTLKKLTDFASKTGAKIIESGDPLFPLNYKTNMDVTGGFCAALAGVLINISYDGDVYFCVTDRKPMFNVFNKKDNRTLEKIYKSELKKYLHSFEISQNCYGCNFLNKCKSGCPTRRRFDTSGEDYWCLYLKKLA